MRWRRVPLGELAETSLGKMLDRGRSRGHSLVPYLRNVNVQWGRIDTNDVLSMELADGERERYEAMPGDLLVCEGGEIGRAAIWRGSGEYMALQKALHRVRPRKGVDPRYLMHFFRAASWDGTLDRYSTGTTIKHLPQQMLRRIPVPVPDFTEQRRVVDMLEDHLTRLDAGAELLRTVDRRLDLAERSSHQALFSDEFPRFSLRELLIDQIGGAWGELPGVLPADVNVVRVTEMGRSGALDVTTAARRSVTRNQMERRRLAPGDLILEKSGGGPSTPVGRVGMFLAQVGDFITSNFMVRMRADTARVSPEWLATYLAEFHARGLTGSLQTASTNIRNLKVPAYLDSLVPVPPLDVQSAVLKEIEGVRGVQTQLLQSLVRTSTRSHRLRRALLTAAFSGKLTGSASDVDRIEELAAAE